MSKKVFSSGIKYSHIFCIVDDDVFEEVSKHKWYCSSIGYLQSRTADTSLHRFIMKAEKGQSVDHINGDISDNRLCNLRICNKAQNAYNSKIPVTNTLGFKGVYFDNRRKKYIAECKNQDKKNYLGGYSTIRLAAHAWNLYALKTRGEFVRLNSIILSEKELELFKKEKPLNAIF